MTGYCCENDIKIRRKVSFSELDRGRGPVTTSIIDKAGAQNIGPGDRVDDRYDHHPDHDQDADRDDDDDN